MDHIRAVPDGTPAPGVPSGAASADTSAGELAELLQRSSRGDEAAFAVAAEIVSNSPWGVAQTKEVMWSQLEVGSLQAGIDLENRTQILASQTPDVQEAILAFMEKRPPLFEPTEPRP